MGSSLTRPESREELYRLASSVLCGHASADEIQRLESLVTGSAEARRSYAEFICDYCNLRAYAERMSVEAPLALAVRQPASRPVALGKGTAAVTQQQSRLLNILRGVLRAAGRPSAVSWIAAATCAAVAGVIFLWSIHSDVRLPVTPDQAAVEQKAGKEPQRSGGDDAAALPREPAKTAAMVARLERASECRWSEAATKPRQGDLLVAGSRLELLSGTAEIVFLDLARVTLQGPATLEIESHDSARLQTGKATVDNPAAANFEFVTPGMIFNLSSAEFTVDLKPNGTEQISVISGNVAAAKSVPGARIYKNGPGGGPPTPEAGPGTMILTANQSRVIDVPAAPKGPTDGRHQRSPHTADDGASADPLGFPRWKESSEKLAKDPALIAYYDFQRDECAPEVLRNRAATGDKLDGRIEGAAWVRGRWPAKGALHFRGPQECVRLNIPGRFDVVTAAAWINLKGLSPPLTSILSSDSWHDRIGQCHWQIVFNGMVELAPCFSTTAGPLTAADITASRKPVLEKNDPGTWCFLASVYDSQANTVTYYRNAKSCGATQSPTHLVPLEIGACEIGNWRPEPGDKAPVRFLPGRIDELMLFSRALTEKELDEMYRSGKKSTR